MIEKFFSLAVSRYMMQHDNGERERLRDQHLVFDLDLALLVDRFPLNAQCILHIFNAFLILLIRASRLLM